MLLFQTLIDDLLPLYRHLLYVHGYLIQWRD
nr:MAG TPA: hypothetical protein [Caudoviricetes sp.]